MGKTIYILQGEIGVQVAHFEWQTLQKQMHFSGKKYLFVRMCACVRYKLPTAKRSTT